MTLEQRIARLEALEAIRQLKLIDIHHGANPEIELLDADQALGRWALYYFNLDGESGATRQLGGIYQDRYLRIAGQWKRVECCFSAHSMVAGQVPASA